MLHAYLPVEDEGGVVLCSHADVSWRSFWTIHLSCDDSSRLAWHTGPSNVYRNYLEKVVCVRSKQIVQRQSAARGDNLNIR